MRIVLLMTLYEAMIKSLYDESPHLHSASSLAQTEAILRSGIGVAHVSPFALRDAGHEVLTIISNVPSIQNSWCREHDSALTGQDLTRHQIEEFRPDVLYTLDPIQFDSRFIAALSPKPRIVCGWRAASIPAGTDFSLFDAIFTSDEACRENIVRHGARRVITALPGFPEWISAKTAHEDPTVDVVFSGQCTPEHTRRNRMLADVAKLPLGIRGDFSISYFIGGNLADYPAGISMYDHGPRWGLEMYRALRSGKITLNGSIDIVRARTANMRLFEATGVGTFLLTEHDSEISKYFTPGVELETYQSIDELADKIYFYLRNDTLRSEIAQRGQRRCLTEHSSARRTEQFLKDISSSA